MAKEKHIPQGVPIWCPECQGHGEITYGPDHEISKLGFEPGTYECPMCGGACIMQDCGDYTRDCVVIARLNRELDAYRLKDPDYDWGDDYEDDDEEEEDTDATS